MRKLAVAGVAAVVAVAAIVLLRGGSGPGGAAHDRAAPTAPATAPASPAQGASSLDPSAVKADARAFLDSYLPYLYGRALLSTVVHVEAGVRALLPATRRSISAREQAKPFDVTDVQTRFLVDGSASVTAQVSEGDPAVGVATYPVTFAMKLRASGWEVVTVPILG